MPFDANDLQRIRAIERSIDAISGAIVDCYGCIMSVLASMPPGDARNDLSQRAGYFSQQLDRLLEEQKSLGGAPAKAPALNGHQPPVPNRQASPHVHGRR